MSTFNLYKIFLLLEPTKCQDLETGTFYKVGAEWYSKDPTLCLKMSCTPNFFPEVTVTRYVLTLPPVSVTFHPRRYSSSPEYI